jgi:hypothetical protein
MKYWNKPKNNHFISKFLTKPWQVDGKLKYICMSDGILKESHPDELFAERGVYSDELEAFLNKRIESIIANQIPRLLQSETGKIENRKVFEAFVLFFYLQAIRIEQAKGKTTYLETMINFPSDQITAMVDHIMNKDNLILMKVSPNQRLFFPSSAVFPVIAFEPDTRKPKIEVCVGMPIHPTCAVIRLPETVSMVWLEPWISTGHLMNFSVGFGKHADKVVVHPDILEHCQSDQIYKNIVSSRGRVQSMFDAIGAKNELLEMFPWLE